MPQSTEEQIQERRATVASLYLKGWTQTAIAGQVGVTQPQISQDLDAIRQGWKDSMLFDFNEAKGRELAKLDHLEQVHWQAWEASMKPLKKKSTRMSGSVDSAGTDKSKQTPKNLESTETTEERLGEYKHLEGVFKCIQKRTELLGLDAPPKLPVEEKNLPSWLRAVNPKPSLN